MKHSNILIAAMLIAVSVSSNGQTSSQKNNFSFGFGKQAYNGDLGNSWFEPEEEWYGYAHVAYNRYLNKSFDLSSSITFGDYGHCREDDESAFRPDGSVVFNMLGRLTSVSVTGKYKLANGYLLKEDAHIAPYAFAGIGFDNISNYWWKAKDRVVTGNYSSLHYGAGARYNLNEKFNITYQLGFGYFTSDKIDGRSEGKNDKFIQNSILFGFNF